MRRMPVSQRALTRAPGVSRAGSAIAAGFAVLLAAAACADPEAAEPLPGDDDDGAGDVCGDGRVTGDEVCDDGDNDALGGGCMPGCRFRDDSDALFMRDDLTRVELEMDEADWDALRHERNTVSSLLGGADCTSRPRVSPYAWYPASVTIDGVRYDEIEIRKKSLIGSQSTLKPSIKLGLDRVVPDQRHLGLARIALNNSRSDASFLRTCLTYRVFTAAGLLAPRCGFATVTLNQRPLGVFVVVEEVGKPFLARRVPDAEGDLYEGTLSDFMSPYTTSFDHEETDARRDPAADPIMALTAVLAGTPDDALLATLEPMVDLEEFFRFWAAESLVWHRDGYAGNTNNYHVYADPSRGGRLRFIPWGPDATFQRDTRDDVPDSVLAFGKLSNRLYALPEGRARYDAALDALLRSVWRPDELLAEADRITALITPALTEAQIADQVALADLTRQVIAERAGVIATARATGAAWTAGTRAPFCRTPVGTVSGSFTTTWGTLAANIFASGSASLTIDGTPLAFSQVGSRAGFAAPTIGRVQMVGDTAAKRRWTITATFPDEKWFESFLAPGDYPLDSPPLGMSMTETDLATTPATTLRRFEIAEGTWTFDTIQTTDGGGVTARYSATLFQLP